MTSPQPGPHHQGLEEPRSAALVVVDPSGARNRVPLEPLPYTIGRQAGNHLVLRDNRISRSHARIIWDGHGYWIEDLKSRHGLYVNNNNVERSLLHNADRIEFGIRDSYHLIFTLEDEELQRVLEQLSVPFRPAAPGAANLAKLRALTEVARALQSSLSTHDVLAAVVDAALTVTGSERGFLLLRRARDDDLEVTVARGNRGAPLAKSELRVPTRLINHALKQRKELLSMSFDPTGREGIRPEMTVADLELSSVICVPLIRIRTGSLDDTCSSTSLNDTVGLLYMDSRIGRADLSGGNRELLQTLAIEASTILENARLIEEERAKQKMEEELKIAREIQKTLLPRSLPDSSFFRAQGSSIPSHRVGGDYFDVRQVSSSVWSAVVADVSGKGVSSALLASLLQGAFLLAAESRLQMEQMMVRINRFLYERTQGEKYATAFYSTLDSNGLLRWANAGHCPPLLLTETGKIEILTPTGTPLGMLPESICGVSENRLAPGDKLVIYSDGLSEARNCDGQFFETRRLRALVSRGIHANCQELHAAIIQAMEEFTDGAVQNDDVTLLVLEYQPD
jgi:serine phosphatase RsbU (regulator of sigma subunit)/pSer/pThr/pTyr-binding forkhead associated (FHA) protein